MKTLHEKHYGYTFDWKATLKKEKIGDAEWIELSLKAGEWVTCACGNQCAIIPRGRNGDPIDQELRELGYSFFMSIDRRRKKDSLMILAAIEQRSAELIAEIKGKK